MQGLHLVFLKSSIIIFEKKIRENTSNKFYKDIFYINSLQRKYANDNMPLFVPNKPKTNENIFYLRIFT